MDLVRSLLVVFWRIGYPADQFSSIVEGLMTIIVAILALILIVDFPEHSTRAFIWTFLSPAEATQVVAFIDSDRQDTQVPEYLTSPLRCFSDH